MKKYENLTNEELVEVYKAEGSEAAFEALMRNTEPLRYKVAQRYLNIPGSELEDLMSEGALEMYKTVCNYESGKASFTSFLYSVLTRLYNTMFKLANSEKRNAHGMVLSFDQMNDNSEYEEDGDSMGNTFFSVECDEYSMIEVRMLIETLGLSDRETLTINLLMDGKTPADIAREIGCKTPTVHSYIKRIGKKLDFSGAYA